MELESSRSTNAAAGGSAAIATPDSLELTTVEELVRRHTPDLLPYAGRGFRLVIQGMFSVLTASVAVPVLAAIGVRSMGSVLGVASAAGVAVGFAVGVMMRDSQRRFQKRLKDSPWLVYDAVASQFVGQVELQRARTIGPESEWGLARHKLDSAANDAERSLAYWTQRLSVEPGSEIAKAQIATATRLRDKFRTALSDLDQRARMLVTFFNDCEHFASATRWVVSSASGSSGSPAKSPSITSKRLPTGSWKVRNGIAARSSAWLDQSESSRLRARTGAPLGGAIDTRPADARRAQPEQSARRPRSNTRPGNPCGGCDKGLRP